MFISLDFPTVKNGSDCMDVAAIWEKVLKLMERELTPTTLNTWFDDAEAVALQGDTFVLYSPQEMKRDVIASRYIRHVQNALQELFSAQFEVKLVADREQAAKGKVDRDLFPPGTEEYTFDKFVVGGSNKFAFAAAQRVAENPTENYNNPLFIYGDSGLGKTHLLYAIAHAVHEKHPDYRIVYIKGDSFTNELVAAIRDGKNHEFRQKFRTADLFLMDDVQFIAGRESTQEEMFHTFNALYENNKQIVFTADRPPKEMLRLDERLVSRFVNGLPVEVAPPDYETRVAIIKNKALRRGMNLPDPVLRYVADNITANVRVIEGTVNKILAFQELMGEEVDVNTVTRAVRDMFKDKSEFLPSADIIIEEVAKFYNLESADLKGQSRNKDTVLARQIAMYEIRRMTNLSLKEIGREFGGRDHTTVIHSIERIETMIKQSPEMADVIKDINTNINARYE